MELRIVLLLLAPLLLPMPARAASSSANPHLARALEQIEALEEEAALQTLEKARVWAGNTARETALFHLYTGLAYAGMARESKAMAAFRNAVVIDPDVTLPKFCAPRVVEWFAKATGRPSPRSADSPSTVARGPRPTAPPQALAAGSEATAASRPSDARPFFTPLRWTGLGLAAAGLATVAVGLVIGANASLDAARAQSAPDLASATAQHDRARSSASTANVLFGAGAAAMLGGGLLVVF